MSERRVLVAGAGGRLGMLVVKELLARGARVTAILRDGSGAQADALRGLGADVTALDVAKAEPDALATAASGAFAVVSTMQGGPDVIIEAQAKLLDAAARAGARRFFPSDFSFDFFALPKGVNVNSDWRRAFAEIAEERRGPVEVVHLLQGMFADALVAGFVGIYDRENNAVRYWGDGTTQIDWTTWEDTAKYLAAAALDEQPVPAKLYVAGDRASVIELAELIAAARKRPSLERLGSLDELREEIAKRLRETPSDMFAWLPLMYALGVFGGLTGLGPLANDRYPDVRPETLAEAIRRGAL